MKTARQPLRKRYMVALGFCLAVLLGASLVKTPEGESREASALPVSYCVRLSPDGTLQLWERADGKTHLLYVKDHVSLREQDAALLSQGIESESREEALMLFEDFAE